MDAVLTVDGTGRRVEHTDVLTAGVVLAVARERHPSPHQCEVVGATGLPDRLDADVEGVHDLQGLRVDGRDGVAQLDGAGRRTGEVGDEHLLAPGAGEDEEPIAVLVEQQVDDLVDR